MNKLLQPLIYLIFILLISVSPAYAYLDPGTGSLITQAAVGFILAAIFTLKLWVGKIKQFISKRKPSANNGQ